LCSLEKILIKIFNVKFHENPSGESRVDIRVEIGGQTEGQKNN